MINKRKFGQCCRGDINRKTSTQSNESASSDHHSGEGSPSPRRTGEELYSVTLQREDFFQTFDFWPKYDPHFSV